MNIKDFYSCLHLLLNDTIHFSKISLTGKLWVPRNDPDTLVSMLTNVFGFPSHMSLKAVTSDPSKHVTWEDGGVCCICKTNISSDNFLCHMEQHIQEDFEANDKRLTESTDHTTYISCSFCTDLVKYSEKSGTEISLKNHYADHFKELREYALQKVTNHVLKQISFTTFMI